MKHTPSVQDLLFDVDLVPIEAVLESSLVNRPFCVRGKRVVAFGRATPKVKIESKIANRIEKERFSAASKPSSRPRMSWALFGAPVFKVGTSYGF
jgi:hypothetical protein